MCGCITIVDNVKKVSKHINDPGILRIKATFNYEVTHVSKPRKLGGNRAYGHILYQGCTHLVQELNVGTVISIYIERIRRTAEGVIHVAQEQLDE